MTEREQAPEPEPSLPAATAEAGIGSAEVPIDVAAPGREAEVAAERRVPVEPTPGAESPGRIMVEVEVLPGPADRTADAGMRPPSETLAPAETTPGRQSPGWMAAQGPAESSAPLEASRGEAWAPAVPGRPADPFLAAIKGVQAAVGQLGAVVKAKEGELEAECARLALEKAQLAGA